MEDSITSRASVFIHQLDIRSFDTMRLFKGDAYLGRLSWVTYHRSKQPILSHSQSLRTGGISSGPWNEERERRLLRLFCWYNARKRFPKCGKRFPCFVSPVRLIGTSQTSEPACHWRSLPPIVRLEDFKGLPEKTSWHGCKHRTFIVHSLMYRTTCCVLNGWQNNF